MHTTFGLYILLLLIILFLVMLAQRLKISYPIVLVLGGLCLSFFPRLPQIVINPELIFVIFLPPLLFEAAWQTSWKDFWKWRRVITSFAFLIVILTSCVIAVISSSLIPAFTLPLGFLLGGIISPPDAVSATSILKSINVPKRLVTIVEGESLLNDASSLIVFRFAYAAIDSGKFVFQEAVISFFVVIIMGILTGLAVALVFYAIHRWLPTTTNIDIVLTFIAPYVMYITAEQFHFSGVLAVVSGGLFLSTRSNVILSPGSRFRGENVWSTIGFALNGIVFMLIGLELPVIVQQLGNVSLAAAIRYGVIISGALIVTRLLCTLGASLFTRFASHFITTADSNPGWRAPIAFGWAGMRGVVSLAAALSIPITLSNGTPFPERNLIIFITFTVILITLVFQGLTLPVVVRWLKLEDNDYAIPYAEQEKMVRRKLSHTGLQVLNEQYAEKVAVNEQLQSLKVRYESDIRLLERLQEEEADNMQLAAEKSGKHYREVVRAVISRQRDLLQKLNKKEEVDEDLVRKYIGLLDLEEEKIRLMVTGEVTE